jgi:hypothetical protein
MDEFDDSSEEKKLSNLFEIQSEQILSGYTNEDLKTFVHDLFLIFKVFDHIDHEYYEGESILIRKDIDKYKSMIKDWNAKYRDIILKFDLGSIECSLCVFIKEEARNIVPLVKNMKGYISHKIHRKDEYTELETVFEGENEGSENTLNLRKEKEILQLIYCKEDMLDPKSPEFRICIYFGLKGGFEHDMNLKKYEKEFSFDLSSEETKSAGDGWSRWYPDVVFYK